MRQFTGKIFNTSREIKALLQLEQAAWRGYSYFAELKTA
jgi:hypothetical protein